MTQIVIFTDLDGTLLDASSYSFEAARPALELIAANGIPLVFNSSKTRAEIEVLRRKVGNTHPFITENGGGIFIPPEYFSTPVSPAKIDGYEAIVLGKPYEEIRRRFTDLRTQHHAAVRGFGDMNPSEVAALTGLPEQDAVLAMQRDFDEPFVFAHESEDGFLRAIEERGLHWTQGRIFHILGEHDKGRAVQLLLDRFRGIYGEITSVALGDGYNDLPMLAAVDHPILIRHDDGGYDPRVVLPGLVKSSLPGPAGWTETLLPILSPILSGGTQ